MSNTPQGETSLLARLSGLFSKSGDYKARYGKAGGADSVDYRQHRRLLRAGELPRKHRNLAALTPNCCRPAVPGRGATLTWPGWPRR